MATSSHIEWTEATWNPVTEWGGVFKSRTGRDLHGRAWDEMPRAEPPRLSAIY